MITRAELDAKCQNASLAYLQVWALDSRREVRRAVRRELRRRGQHKAAEAVRT